MFARVMSSVAKIATIDEIPAEWRKHIAPYKDSGLAKAFLFVDRETGKYLSITLWNDNQQQATNAISPEQKTGRADMARKYLEYLPEQANYEVLSVID